MCNITELKLLLMREIHEWNRQMLWFQLETSIEWTRSCSKSPNVLWSACVAAVFALCLHVSNPVFWPHYKLLLPYGWLAALPLFLSRSYPAHQDVCSRSASTKPSIWLDDCLGARSLQHSPPCERQLSLTFSQRTHHFLSIYTDTLVALIHQLTNGMKQ